MTKLRTIWVNDSDRKKFDEIMRSKNQLSKRLVLLYEDICRTPFKGKGGPHQLTGNYKDWWARDILGSTRLVYNVDKDILIIKELNINYHKSSIIDKFKYEV
jgi:Txe/YoeB family toxin of toxin-antitoxin system